jgi:hypothetical protein
MPTQRQRDRFVLGLQFAAGLLFAQQIAGKAARDGLFLLQYGPHALPAMIAGAAAFSVALSLLSGKLLHRLEPRRVVPWSLGISGALQVVECWLLGVSPELASVLIYLHMAGVGVVLLSTFWSMLNEEFDPHEAKRRFGQIAAGGTIGGLIGGMAAERAVAWSGAPALMLMTAGLHLACAGLVVVLMRGASGGPVGANDAAGRPAASPAPHRSALLRTLGTIVLLGSLGAALLDYVFKVYATDMLGREVNLLRFFAFFHAGVAVASFVMQSTLSKWALEKLGLGKTILTLPATLAGGSFLALLLPSAWVALAARAAEAAVRGSLFRAGYETCYTPVPAAEKRLAKGFIDVASERGGDALGAALVYVCLLLAGTSATPWILSAAALVGLTSLVMCSALDRIYVRALARSLESRAVQLSAPSEMDLTTRSLVMRVPVARAALAFSESGTAERIRQDLVLRKLMALRSDDLREVHAALAGSDVSDPVVATQVCMLLGREEHAPLARTVLLRSAGRVLGLLTDLMMDSSLDVGVRRRIPRIIGAAPGQRAVDALMCGLEDRRFEVRMQCAKALVKAAAQEPRPLLRRDLILAAVDRELAVGMVLWESHRRQQQEPGELGSEWLDDLLREKAHGGLEYVFALLSMIHDRTPLMTAFRSLHTEDRHLRGTALEYLEGILPAKTREMLWQILQERPAVGRDKQEIMQDLLRASDTVVLQLRKRGPEHSA